MSAYIKIDRYIKHLTTQTARRSWRRKGPFEKRELIMKVPSRLAGEDRTRKKICSPSTRFIHLHQE
jgi:hypothetical protein